VNGESPDLRSMYASVDWSAQDFSKGDPGLARNVLARLGELPGNRILDLGCGSAALAVELARLGYETTGLDFFIEPARRRVAATRISVRLLEQDMAAMSFRGEFDAVVNWDASGIGLLPEDRDNIDIVRRVHRALVPGGKFLIETYHAAWAHRRGVEGLSFDAARNRFVGEVKRVAAATGPVRTWPLSLRLFAPEEWNTIFAEIGFEMAGTWGSLAGDPLSDDSMMLVLLGRKM
jgi:SAM-dependent methyltransferase